MLAPREPIRRCRQAYLPVRPCNPCKGRLTLFSIYSSLEDQSLILERGDRPGHEMVIY